MILQRRLKPPPFHVPSSTDLIVWVLHCWMGIWSSSTNRLLLHSILTFRYTWAVRCSTECISTTSLRLPVLQHFDSLCCSINYLAMSCMCCSISTPSLCVPALLHLDYLAIFCLCGGILTASFCRSWAFLSFDNPACRTEFCIAVRLEVNNNMVFLF